MLDMDELVHEADCLAQALRELLSGTTHAGQEAQKYLVGELASRVSIIRKLWGNSLRPRAAGAYFLVLRAEDVYKTPARFAANRISASAQSSAPFYPCSIATGGGLWLDGVSCS
jgi:hypothetical protein